MNDDDSNLPHQAPESPAPAPPQIPVNDVSPPLKAAPPLAVDKDLKTDVAKPATKAKEAKKPSAEPVAGRSATAIAVVIIVIIAALVIFAYLKGK
ncbi:MAG: hypothetical protein ACREF7_01485 [Candidatus Saccharimonadales bacterium]